MVYPRRTFEPLLATRLALLMLGGLDSPRSARLSLRVTNRSTRSLHWFSNTFKASHSALSVSDLGNHPAGALVI